MEQISISAKNLGDTATEDFCPRCFWVKLKTANKLPWQHFPGIFSSLDAFQKKVIQSIIDSDYRPPWMNDMGDIVSWVKPPHWSKFFTVNEKYNIHLNGMTDGILVRSDDKTVIPDWKTAKYTKNQDKLLPLYGIQLNGYGYIHEDSGMGDIEALYLVYFQPCTDEVLPAECHKVYGYDMRFAAKTIEMEINRDGLYEAMEITREIYERKLPPVGREKCKDCSNLDGVMELLT